MSQLLDTTGAPRLGAPIAALLAAQAARNPAAAALSLAEGSLSRLEMEKRSNQRARQLLRSGVGHNDVVIVALPNGAAFYEFVHGAWKVGATPLHVSHKLTSREFAEIVALAQPRIVLSTQSAVANATGRDEAEDPLPLAIAQHWKISTSGGSTGRPKLIVDPNPAIWSEEKQGLRRGADEIIVNPGPLYHSAPFALMILALCEGAHVIEMGRFDPQRYLELASQHKASWAFLVPTMMARIANLPREVRQAHDLSTIRTLVHMASICPPPVKRAWIDWLGADAVWEIYGGTERIGSSVIGGDEWLEHPGSVGRPRPGIEARILDEGGAALPAGEVGEIYFRRKGGPDSTFRYIGADVRRRGDWATFGDMGWLDADGYLYIADRRTDMIVCGGVNLFPAEIEAQIDALEGVADSVVVGAPHRDLGQTPFAFVQLAPGAEWRQDDLVEALRQRLAPHKLPRGVAFLRDTIRDESGKIRRAAWRDRLLQSS